MVPDSLRSEVLKGIHDECWSSGAVQELESGPSEVLLASHRPRRERLCLPYGTVPFTYGRVPRLPVDVLFKNILKDLKRTGQQL